MNLLKYIFIDNTIDLVVTV